MKITICGSIAAYEEMLKAKEQLEQLGHEVQILELSREKMPGMSIQDFYEVRKAATAKDGWIWDKKQEAMHAHFGKVAWSDAIVVLNPEKKGIPGYVGANTLLEMGLAMYLGKKIYLLNPVPEVAYKEEIYAMKPEILENNFEGIGGEYA